MTDLSKLRVGLDLKATNCKQVSPVFQASVARSDEARARGLSNRSTPLKRDEAMLFVFDPAQKVGFWMKDTLIPLDIHFFTDKGKLARSAQMPVETDPTTPTRSYESGVAIATALEVAPGALKGAKSGVAALCVDTVSP